MRVPRPRFTVRSLMVVVAVVALMTSTAVWVRRQYAGAEALYRDPLIYHRTNAAFLRFAPEAMPPRMGSLPVPQPTPAELRRERRRAEYHEAMVDKYERALRSRGSPYPRPA